MDYQAIYWNWHHMDKLINTIYHFLKDNGSFTPWALYNTIIDVTLYIMEYTSDNRFDREYATETIKEILKEGEYIDVY